MRPSSLRTLRLVRSEIIVGLDVGTTKVCAVVGDVTKTGIDLVGHGLAECRGLNKGVVVDIEATVAAIEKAVAAAEQATGFRIRSVAVGITGQHIESVNHSGAVSIQKYRDISEEDVEQALDAAQRLALPAGREVIHNIPRVFTIDGHHGVRRPVGMSGTELEVETHIVTAESSCVQNLVKCLHQAELAIIPGGIILEALATAEAVLTPDEAELGVALVDIGGGTSDVALFRWGSAFHTAAIPVGGNHVTNDLAVGLRVARADAEQIKLAHGTALDEGIAEDDALTITPLGHEGGEGVPIPRKIIPEIVQPRMAELFEMVRDEIERAGAAGQLPAGLVLSGGGSQLPGCLEVAGQVLEMPVRLGTPTHPAAATGDLRRPSFATGVGLVQYAARHRQAADDHEKPLVGALVGRISRWLRRLFS